MVSRQRTVELSYFTLRPIHHQVTYPTGEVDERWLLAAAGRPGNPAAIGGGGIAHHRPCRAERTEGGGGVDRLYPAGLIPLAATRCSPHLDSASRISIRSLHRS